MPRLSKKKYQRGGWGEAMVVEPSYEPKPTTKKPAKKSKTSVNKKSKSKKNKSKRNINKSKNVNKQRAGGWGSTTRTVYNLKGGWGGCSQSLPVMTGGGWGATSRNIVVDVSPKQTGGFRRFLKKHF